MGEPKSQINRIENSFEALIPRNRRADAKTFMDQFMPLALILLGSMVAFHFFISVDQQLSDLVNLINFGLVLFFGLRLGLAFSLADSHKKFLRQHWFDAVLVIPSLAILKEARLLMLLESETEEQAYLGFLFARNTTIAGQITKMYAWGRRALQLS